MDAEWVSPSNSKMFNFTSPTIIALMGVPSSGKSTIARELAKQCNGSQSYLEGEEDEYPLELKAWLLQLNRAGNVFAVYSYFRNIRMQHMIAATANKHHLGRSAIIDCYFDKLMADAFDDDKREALSLFINRQHVDFPLVQKLAYQDRDEFPDADVIIFLRLSREMQQTFVSKRHRDFECDYSRMDEMQMLFLKASRKFAEKHGKKLIIIEQEDKICKVVGKILTACMTIGILKPTQRTIWQVVPIQNLYDVLRQGQRLDTVQCSSLIKQLNDATEVIPHQQIASLAAQMLLLKTKLNLAESVVLLFIRQKFPRINQYLRVMEGKSMLRGKLNQILAKTYQRIDLSEKEIKWLLKSFDEGHVTKVFMAIWMMTVTYRGLCKANTFTMTHVMRNSGEIFDYRNLPELEFRKITRRYPTGGLSEKIALIMPSVISAFAERYPIASNFLVAKALSYTGGTWDKLNAIPGFWFPRQGREALDVMRQCHVAMTVTNENFNSLDRKLYQMRGTTGCVESIPLITASIASKLLAIPADFVLLDVRYGDGAFVGNYEEGNKLGSMISNVIRLQGFDCDFMLTEMQQPNGLAIGHALEVIESIALMKGETSVALLHQRELVVKMFARMLHRLFPHIKSECDFQEEIYCAFSNGDVLRAFRCLLSAHRVNNHVIDALIEDPHFLIREFIDHLIVAKHAGIITRIDQKKLGAFVNFELNTGLNEYTRVKRSGGGIILHVRLGDSVQIGDTLCRVIATPQYLTDCRSVIDDYFCDIFAY